MDGLIVSLLNGLSYGLLLFMLSAGLTLIFSMMGIINFAHASFYMLGAYAAHAVAGALSPALTAGAAFWVALFIAPVLVGLAGTAVERLALRRLRGRGHVAELLFTFALAMVIAELVQLAWGRSAVPYRMPAAWGEPLFSLGGHAFPLHRLVVALAAGLMLAALWWGLTRTRTGLVVRAALSHPAMAQALGHDVPRVFMLVFGAGCLLAGMAGAIGGSVFVTEPGMAQALGPIVFVVTVVGGLGSLAGAFWASLLIGVLQTLAVGSAWSLAAPATWLGAADAARALAAWPLSRVAPVLPYLLMVAVLVWRPRGLMGVRET
ncbi:branched-chain amino acid ABC transporter permease [Pigmentiphaga sp. GD03639]|uniref:Amino acid/amide ABC transporter membrane protein 1 (HAAT family) n=1 Tax=Pigmentiphaga kullae TaxID=151784 RepID=A0A4Q7NC01_9BURK|nr:MULTISPECIES: branched-chain amino acid ABC transporter permease [Pigmentiphaga]MDH2235954.1 branched-chain amino acid ABC transporter permease [Pigmentiphaga sp. GD03639]RZS80459.1 amino acid/amide ABC transporter membrane protein 1 (HAAT family) [Pigmentiphaga kullae]